MSDNKEWIDEFIKLKFPISNIDINFDKARLLKNKHLPKQIFRYLAFNAYSIYNLQTNTVWMASPEMYNDPFDSASNIVFGQQPEISNKDAEEIASNFLSKKTKDTIGQDKLIEILSNPSKRNEYFRVELSKELNCSEEKADEFIQIVNDGMLHITSKNITEKMNKDNQKKLKVCSFSEINHSVAMWSHYTGNHTGFCIEYDITSLQPTDSRRNHLFPVIYKEQLFDASPYFNELNKIVEKSTFNIFIPTLAAMHKSPEWSYEKEWRFINQLGLTRPYEEFPMQKPKAVYLGAKMSNGDKKIVSNIVNSKGIPLYEMRISSTEFKMIPNDVKNKGKTS